MVLIYTVYKHFGKNKRHSAVSAVDSTNGFMKICSIPSHEVSRDLSVLYS